MVGGDWVWEDLLVHSRAGLTVASIRKGAEVFATGILAFAVGLGVSGIVSAAAASGRSQSQLLRKGYESQFTGHWREYFVYLPVGYHTEPGNQWPVILFLHGGGERGNAVEDLDRVLAHGPIAEAWIQGRDLPFIMISPQMPLFERPLRSPAAPAPAQVLDGLPPPRNRGRRPERPMARTTDPDIPSFGTRGASESWLKMSDEVLAMVDSTLNEYRGDEDRVYLTGLSFGGAGTWHLAMSEPERWAAIAPICGPGDPELTPGLVEANTPVWVFQGGRDTTVRPERVLETVKALEAAGHPDVRFTVHEDLGHNVWTRVYEGWDLYGWFLTHRR